MAERALPFVNVAMWSGGSYSTATKGAKAVIDGATPLVLEAIRRMPDTDPTARFTMTDMGCADGGTSLEMVGQAVGAARARWPQRPVTVVYADQPRNDYNSLLHLLHGLTPLLTYLDEFEDVHVLASATSFYRPILPAGTLDLGFSATAMHWLSHKPCDLTTHVHMMGPRAPSWPLSLSRGGATGKPSSCGGRASWHRAGGWCWSISVRMKPAATWATRAA